MSPQGPMLSRRASIASPADPGEWTPMHPQQHFLHMQQQQQQQMQAQQQMMGMPPDMPPMLGRSMTLPLGPPGLGQGVFFVPPALASPQGTVRGDGRTHRKQLRGRTVRKLWTWPKLTADECVRYFATAAEDNAAAAAARAAAGLSALVEAVPAERATSLSRLCGLGALDGPVAPLLTLLDRTGSESLHRLAGGHAEPFNLTELWAALRERRTNDKRKRVQTAAATTAAAAEAAVGTPNEESTAAAAATAAAALAAWRERKPRKQRRPRPLALSLAPMMVQLNCLHVALCLYFLTFDFTRRLALVMHRLRRQQSTDGGAPSVAAELLAQYKTKGWTREHTVPCAQSHRCLLCVVSGVYQDLVATFWGRLERKLVRYLLQPIELQQDEDLPALTTVTTYRVGRAIDQYIDERVDTGGPPVVATTTTTTPAIALIEEAPQSSASPKLTLA